MSSILTINNELWCKKCETHKITTRVCIRVIIAYALLHIATATIAAQNHLCNSVADYDFHSEVTTSSIPQPIITQSHIEKSPLAANQDGILFKYTFSNFSFGGLTPEQETTFVETDIPHHHQS